MFLKGKKTNKSGFLNEIDSFIFYEKKKFYIMIEAFWHLFFVLVLRTFLTDAINGPPEPTPRPITYTILGT